MAAIDMTTKNQLLPLAFALMEGDVIRSGSVMR
jgi:hypothetical protein